MNLSSKAKQIAPSLTLSITAKAKEMSKNGIDVVSFGAGEPDFNTPENIQNAAIKAIKNGLTKYTAASGINELKEAIVNKFKSDNGLDYSNDQIIISTGAKQCLANAFQAILNRGDEVLVPTPYWVSYPELIKLADGVPVFVNNKKSNGYKYSLDVLEECITANTRAIIVNSPNNPTGCIYTRDELKMIADFAKKYNLIIISDEIYEKLIYGDNKHISIASLSEDAYNRAIVINGVSKSYAMTGWRIGYAASSKEIIKLMSSIQSHTTSNPNSIAQYAALEALNGDQSSMNLMVKEFEKRRDSMIDRINKIDKVSCLKADGAFYIMIDVSNFYGKKIKESVINDSLEFSRVLLEEENVAVIPGDAFGLGDYIRVSYATSMENIEKGLEKIQKFLLKLE
ncbi:pyridoxal phosphate-dependent aminotransferase [Clostridium brassicae]|uniref:Aminotransferase n=1 Tax=Clostridium brassicae TaxID=2999072 RepID=A0ABT4D7V4_9CLOT|nr:pyridoxal phosphate-dependent aminotransferase [Clostridium brassicae]MCY6958238.1 pyridoxal phosphate-dependent aminotransferase [Clostridium brassicae]